MAFISNIKTHLQFIKTGFLARMTYRFDFFVSVIAFFLYPLTGPLFVGVIYYAGGKFQGWDIYQVIFLQGVLTLIKGFSFMLFFGISWLTELRVREGRFDLFLVRPVNTLWLLTMEAFDEEDAGQFIAGITLIIFALNYVEIQGSWILFAILSIFGLLFIFSLALLRSAAAIILIRVYRLHEITDMIYVFAGYPKSIYSKNLSILFSTIVPLFVIANYPASALLGFTTDGMYVALISVIIFLTCSLAIWNLALKHHTSAGG